MVFGGTHAVDELAVVRQQQQAGGVLVQPAHRLHTSRRAATALTNRRRQQGVNAGVGAGFLRTLIPGGFVQHQVCLGVVFPGHALNLEVQPLRYEFHSGIHAWRIGYGHKSLLNQAGADASRAKTLGEKNVLQLHVSHLPIVARQLGLAAYLGKRRLLAAPLAAHRYADIRCGPPRVA